MSESRLNTFVSCYYTHQHHAKITDIVKFACFEERISKQTEMAVYLLFKALQGSAVFSI